MSAAVARGIVICLLATLGGWTGAAELVFDDVQVELQGSRVLVDADIVYHLSPVVQEALDHGVPLTFELHLQLRPADAWIWESDIADIRVRSVLRYHPLSALYELRELESGSKTSYATRQAALRALGRIRDYPIVVRGDQLEPGKEYVLRLRAYLDNDALPLPLRPQAYLSRDWSVKSETWEWRLRP
jgi:hypothetical protein